MKLVHKVFVRLDDLNFNYINYLSKRYKRTKSEIIRNLIEGSINTINYFEF